MEAKPRQITPEKDTLIISASNIIINKSTDSLLHLEVILKNINKTPFRYFTLYSNSRGEVCWSPFWTIEIIKSDSNQRYEPPFLLCHGAPTGVLRKNEEYRYNLMINFKWLLNLKSDHYSTNYDFGEYSLRLILKTKSSVLESNIIKLLYKDN